MTPLQAESHAEQMEAARAEFNLFWQYELLPAVLNLQGVETDQEFAFVQHICWLAFTRAKGLQ